MPIFIEKEEYDFLLCSARFCEKIDRYSGLLNLNQAEVNAYKNENDLFNYVFANNSSYGSLAESFVRYKMGSMQELFYDLVSKCRSSRNYTWQIGAELGIIITGAHNQPIKHCPEVNLRFDRQGYPLLTWTNCMLDGVEIWKDSGNGKGYEKLSFSGGSEYTDKTELPCVNQEVWKYTLIYLYKDEMVGDWSDVQEAIVSRQQKLNE